MDKKKGSIWHRYKVWARAVHIDQIRGKDYKHQQMNPHTCSNCELEFMGEYCPRCGQHIGTARITLKNIVQIFFKEFFDLEDGLQMKCAENAVLDYIVTENLKDFRNSKIPAISIEEVLKRL